MERRFDCFDIFDFDNGKTQWNQWSLINYHTQKNQTSWRAGRGGWLAANGRALNAHTVRLIPMEIKETDAQLI